MVLCEYRHTQTEIIMAKVTCEHCLHQYLSLEKLRWNGLHPSGFFLAQDELLKGDHAQQ